MTERPILFSDPMMQAIWAKRKTQTRRLARPHHVPGDLLYCRHAFSVTATSAVLYRARLSEEDGQWYRWRPGMHMPKEFATTWLRVDEVRSEPLLSISHGDALAEGLEERDAAYGLPDIGWWFDPRLAYFKLWDHINGADEHKADPEVWVTAFTPVEHP